MKKVYLHGFATNPLVWRSFSPELAPQLDFSNLEAAAEQIAVPDSILIGWSMGGMAALLAAARFPKNVKKLVLISTTPKFVGEPCGSSLALLHNLKKQIAKAGVRAFHELLTADLSQPGLAQIPVEQAAKELLTLSQVDLIKYLPLIASETLIIHGEQDQICLPRAGDLLQATIRQSRLGKLAGVGHDLPISCPAKLKGLIDEFCQ